MRLDRETVEILEAIMFLEGRGSLQELLAPIVEKFAQDRAKDRSIREMLKGRARYQAALWDPAEK